MHEAFKQFVLKLLRVPSEPSPPAGAPDSVRTFRASRRYYAVSLLGWAITQALAVAGIIFVLQLDFIESFSSRVQTLIRGFELLGLGAWLLQLPFTYFMVRLDYELRWYIVTDRSLRIRTGVNRVREMTLTFANIQQITVKQGPLQQVLGIADVQATTAGGGGSHAGEEAGSHGSSDAMHVGCFRGVDNAPQIRDLILDRLRKLRDAGLGDPDDTEPEHAPRQEDSAVKAACALLEEVRLLRGAILWK